jgi:hypothetical protein
MSVVLLNYVCQESLVERTKSCELSDLVAD